MLGHGKHGRRIDHSATKKLNVGMTALICTAIALDGHRAPPHTMYDATTRDARVLDATHLRKRRLPTCFIQTVQKMSNRGLQIPPICKIYLVSVAAVCTRKTRIKAGLVYGDNFTAHLT
jgi:hypothetical protein